MNINEVDVAEMVFLLNLGQFIAISTDSIFYSSDDGTEWSLLGKYKEDPIDEELLKEIKTTLSMAQDKYMSIMAEG